MGSMQRVVIVGPGAAGKSTLAARLSQLGPYDSTPQVPLEAADTVVFLDFSPLRCAWRAIRRSPERADFWI
jgi:deoxyadenosine/deoxycytidine kinase